MTGHKAFPVQYHVGMDLPHTAAGEAELKRLRLDTVPQTTSPDLRDNYTSGSMCNPLDAAMLRAYVEQLILDDAKQQGPDNQEFIRTSAQRGSELTESDGVKQYQSPGSGMAGLDLTTRRLIADQLHRKDKQRASLVSQAWRLAMAPFIFPKITLAFDQGVLKSLPSRIIRHVHCIRLELSVPGWQDTEARATLAARQADSVGYLRSLDPTLANTFPLQPDALATLARMLRSTEHLTSLDVQLPHPPFESIYPSTKLELYKLSIRKLFRLIGVVKPAVKLGLAMSNPEAFLGPRQKFDPRDALAHLQTAKISLAKLEVCGVTLSGRDFAAIVALSSLEDLCLRHCKLHPSTVAAGSGEWPVMRNLKVLRIQYENNLLDLLGMVRGSLPPSLEVCELRGERPWQDRQIVLRALPRMPVLEHYVGQWTVLEHIRRGRPGDCAKLRTIEILKDWHQLPASEFCSVAAALPSLRNVELEYVQMNTLRDILAGWESRANIAVGWLKPSDERSVVPACLQLARKAQISHLTDRTPLIGLHCPLLEAVAPCHLYNDTHFVSLDPQLSSRKEVEVRRTALVLDAPYLDLGDQSFRKLSAERANKFDITYPAEIYKGKGLKEQYELREWGKLSPAIWID